MRIAILTDNFPKLLAEGLKRMFDRINSQMPQEEKIKKV